jgi:hypothetical protein
LSATQIDGSRTTSSLFLLRHAHQVPMILIAMKAAP